MNESEFMTDLFKKARLKKLPEIRSLVFSLFFFKRFGILYNESYQDEWIDRFLKGTELIYGDEKSQEIIKNSFYEVKFILGVTR